MDCDSMAAINEYSDECSTALEFFCMSKDDSRLAQ
jgi:hypothetical protein